MKLQMEFEEADLQEMLEEFFGSRGFDVSNMETLLARFGEVYPEGFKVNVYARSISVKNEVPEVKEEATPVVTSETPRVTGDNQALSMSDLLDHTEAGSRPPSRDELLAERELRHILQQSEALTQPTEDS